MKGKLIIIDGNSLVNRAFYALPRFTTSTGEPTNAVYGFLTMLLRLLDEEDPQYIGVAFDLKSPTFRHTQYEAYKAHRTGMPDDLGVQIPILKEVLKALRIPIFEVEGYEADDVLATLATRAGGSGIDTIIVTGDKDALQLISSRIRCMLTRKGISEVKMMGEKEMMDELGVTPEQIVDVKGLMGDASDNIPGVPGIGEKTALKLVREFGSVEGVLSNIDKVKGKKLKEALSEWGSQALMSKDLATLVKNVPLDFSLKDCERKIYDEACLTALFDRLEFRSLMEKMGLKQTPQASLTPPPVEIVEGAAGEFNWEGPVEVVSEDSGEGQPLALAVFPPEGKGVCVFPGAGGGEVLDLVGSLAADPEISKRGYRLKPLLAYLLSRGVTPSGFDFDAEIAAYLLEPTRSSYKIQDLVKEHVGCGLVLTEEYLEGRKSRKAPGLVDESKIASYLAEVAEGVRRIREPLLEALEEAEMSPLFEDLEMPLMPILADMETAGIEVDPGQLEEMGKELQGRIDNMEAEIHHMAGTEFNINSTRQLGQVLFERLKLPVLKKTKTGYSTDAEVLEQLAVDHDVAARVLEYRQLVKLKSTYVDGLQAVIDPRTRRVHTTFHQTITATGRLSSSDPNLQNIPVRLDMGRRIRKVFRAREGHLLVAGDYSQIELRILAHLSGDPVLMEAFHRDEDVHTRTAAEVFGVEVDAVSGEMRNRAKAVNFGIVYGISDFGLARDIGVPISEASAYIQGYFKRYSGVKSFIDRVIAEAGKRGYVSTILGRRRPIPDILSRNRVQRGFAERTAMNTPIQGSAADIIKLAMLRIYRKLAEEGMKSRMILQVHDELIFEVPQDEVEKLQGLIKKEMEEAYPLDVPLKVDIKFGPNWYDMKRRE